MWYMDSVALNDQGDTEGGQQWLLMYKLIFLIPLILVFAINMVSPSLTITLSFTSLSLSRPPPPSLSLSLSLSVMKGCRWMTYHLTVHTIIMHMNKKTNKRTTVCLNLVLKMTACLYYELKMLRILKALYKCTDRFLPIF